MLTHAGGESTEKAHIEINAAERRPPISRWLFGKFTEHLGANVYQEFSGPSPLVPITRQRQS